MSLYASVGGPFSSLLLFIISFFFGLLIDLYHSCLHSWCFLCLLLCILYICVSLHSEHIFWYLPLSQLLVVCSSSLWQCRHILKWWYWSYFMMWLGTLIENILIPASCAFLHCLILLNKILMILLFGNIYLCHFSYPFIFACNFLFHFFFISLSDVVVFPYEYDWFVCFQLRWNFWLRSSFPWVHYQLCY